MQQEERSDRSRAALLEAALALFSSQGYRATSVRDIVASLDRPDGPEGGDHAVGDDDIDRVLAVGPDIAKYQTHEAPPNIK